MKLLTFLKINKSKKEEDVAVRLQYKQERLSPQKNKQLYSQLIYLQMYEYFRKHQYSINFKIKITLF